MSWRTAALCVAVLLFLLPTSCKKKEKDMIPNFEDRSKVPGMWLDSVTTLISDSGIIRYKVVTAKWDAYDKADDPYWYFPEKLYFERFNDTLVIESTVECDTAWYYYDRKVWVLKQNVKIRNLSGEIFETTLMNWDQNAHRVYSDTSFISIRQSSQVVVGHGFDSNESMTRYTVHEIEGMFPVDKENDTATDSMSVENMEVKPRNAVAVETKEVKPRNAVAVKAAPSSPQVSPDGRKGSPFKQTQKKVQLSDD